ncbi:alkaline phosphatase D family protein [uncultured Eudoraea sp.]|uniref:alkaline phosphatase D family protein n=1 Tax=uncultured Eudoraea sp. TaxID=1035614 RepID=UPI0026275907|nr:alkaline phosphatase D family protein [uncultured Eudoraea sp.]
MDRIQYPNHQLDLVLIGKPAQFVRSFMIQPVQTGMYLLSIWPKGSRDLSFSFLEYFDYQGLNSAPFYKKIDLTLASQITDWEWILYENSSVNPSDTTTSDFILSGGEVVRGTFNLNIDQPGIPINQRYIAWSCNQPFLGKAGEPVTIGPYTESVFQWYKQLVHFMQPDEVWAFGDTTYSDGVPETNFVDKYYDKVDLSTNEGAKKELLLDYRRMYIYGWSWSDLQYVMRNFPHCCVWDDHEIRDGWGSEQNDFKDSNYPIGGIARIAADNYILNMGPRVRPVLDIEIDQPDAHQARIEGVAANFVFDGRTSRNYRDRNSTLVSDEQLDDFEFFLDEVKKDSNIKYLLLGCAVPLINLKDFVEILASKAPKELTDLIGGIRDDVRDSWHSPGNKPGLKIIIDMIRNLVLDRNDIEVLFISGDIHVANAFSFHPARFPKPCYQLTTSAITNREHLSELGSKFLSVGETAHSDTIGEITRLWDEIQDPNFLDIKLTPTELTASLYVYNTEKHDNSLEQDYDPLFTLNI